MRAISDVAALMAVAIFLWFMLSFVDVLCHNDPLTGDFNYHPLNLICVIEEVGR